MSRNHREPVKPVESEESDDAESEEESESDSEPEPTPAQKNSAKPQQTPTPTPTPQPPPSSSSEEEEESGETESESDEEESKSKPPPSKPVEKSTNGAKNGRSKPSASVAAATPTKAVASKRSAPEGVSTPKGSKKAKTNDGVTSEKKSVSSLRVFTEDDETVILQGMNDYRSEKNSNPVTDLDGFYEYIKDKLQADLSNTTQLRSKIKRLKKKFVSNNDKEKEGKLKLLANSRDQKSYELSKLFWENVIENGVEGSQKARSVAKKAPTKKAATEEVKNAKIGVAVGVEDVKNLAFFGEPKKLSSDNGASMEEIMLKTGRRVYEAGEGIEGEDEWSKLRAEELELYIKQLEVRAAQAKLVLGVIKPQDH